MYLSFQKDTMAFRALLLLICRFSCRCRMRSPATLTALPCTALHCSDSFPIAAQRSGAQRSAAQRSAVQRSAAQHSTAQRSTVFSAQHSTARYLFHSTAQHSTVFSAPAQFSHARRFGARHSTVFAQLSHRISRQPCRT